MVAERRPSLLADLVDLTGQGSVDLRPVAGAAERADVLAAVLTDEELHWLGHPDRAPKAFLDAPRLARLRDAEQQAALETAALIMAARGELDWSREPAVSYGAHAVVGTIRRNSASVAILRCERRGAGRRLSAVYQAAPDLLLVEYVSDWGLHDFVFRAPRLATATLAAEVDPNRRAVASTAPRMAASVSDLAPSPAGMVETCEASSLLYHAHLTSPETMVGRALTVYSGTQGVWALAGRQPGAGTPGQVIWQQLDAAGLLGLLAAFLAWNVAGDPSEGT